MRFKRTREEETRLGIAPLIDIVFLLLIFFMLTSHFDVASGVRIRLPQVAQKLYEQKKSRATLVIDSRGNLYLEGKPLDQETLNQTLQRLVSDKGLTHLILQADKDVRHGAVVGVMEEASRYRQDGIGLNIIMLDDAPRLRELASTLARKNLGRVFFTSPNKLGEVVVEDYLGAKKERL